MLTRLKRIKLLQITMLILVVGIITGYIANVFPNTADIHTVDAAGVMKVHYMNVGESDSVLIQSGGQNMLIDAGDVGGGDDITAYLRKQGVKKLDYIIATHPHADHIGGMSEVIQSFSVGKVIMTSKTNTTQTFKNMLMAIKQKKIKITKPNVGDTYKLSDASFTIVAPDGKDYGSNINNYSIGIKLVHGKNSFLFIGDNETESIGGMLKTGISLKSDVLMCGHHGSDTSTNRSLLNAVSPKYAIISVGNNSYGHPSKDTLSLLKQKKITLYRTDQNGTIIATSDKSKIRFKSDKKTIRQDKGTNDKGTNNNNTPKVDKTTPQNSNNTTVYTTKTGTKYHKSTCSYLKTSNIKISLKDAKAKGLTPCSRCNPIK